MRNEIIDIKLIGGNPTYRLPGNMKIPDNFDELPPRKRPLAQNVRISPRKIPKEPADESDRSSDEDRESDSDEDNVDIMFIDSSSCDADKNVITPYSADRGT